MALVVTDDKHYGNIADVIRQKLGTDEKIKPDEMGNKILAVCEKVEIDNYNLGCEQGEKMGHADGRKSEWSDFWDAYQQNGNRKNYYCLFQWGGWNEKTFKPKYDMQPTEAGNMFYQFNRHEDGNTSIDLVELLNDVGVTLDFSKATNMNYCFQNAKVSHIGVIDLSSATTVNTVFCNTYWLYKIDKIIVNENNVFDNNCFLNCAVTSITFEGVLASDLRLAGQPLDKASIESVVGVLSDAISGKTLTLNKTAVQKAFETANGANDGNTSEAWLTLAATKPNWTITLV